MSDHNEDTTRRQYIQTIGATATGVSALGSTDIGSARQQGEQADAIEAIAEQIEQAQTDAGASSGGEVEWTFPEYPAIKSAPAVVNGTVYVGTGRGILAISAADGGVMWEFDEGDIC